MIRAGEVFDSVARFAGAEPERDKTWIMTTSKRTLVKLGDVARAATQSELKLRMKRDVGPWFNRRRTRDRDVRSRKSELL